MVSRAVAVVAPERTTRMMLSRAATEGGLQGHVDLAAHHVPAAPHSLSPSFASRGTSSGNSL